MQSSLSVQVRETDSSHSLREDQSSIKQVLQIANASPSNWEPNMKNEASAWVMKSSTLLTYGMPCPESENLHRHSNSASSAFVVAKRWKQKPSL